MAESSVNEEFFDIDRQRLLAEIRDRVVEHRGTPEISSLERAVLWVSHTSLLERLLQNPEMFTLAFNGIRTMNVAGLWLQVAGSTPGASPRVSPSSSLTTPPRNMRAKEKALDRDGGHCVLTGFIAPDVCHIYPMSLSLLGRNMARATEFWNVLRCFWPPERINSWREAILPSGPDSCINMICLSPNLHRLWNLAKFAMKPVDAPNKRTVRVQFFWLHSLRGIRLENPLDLLTRPNLTPTQTPCEARTDGSGILASGDIIELTTDDPETKPLPSLALMEMQWVLMRLAAMCAAGERLGMSYDGDDDDDDDDDYPLDEVDAYGGSPMVWSWSPPTGKDSTPQFDAQTLFHILNSMVHGDTEKNLADEGYQAHLTTQSMDASEHRP